MIQLSSQHPLVEPFGRPGTVPLDDGSACALDGLHQWGMVGSGNGRL